MNLRSDLPMNFFITVGPIIPKGIDEIAQVIWPSEHDVHFLRDQYIIIIEQHFTILKYSMRYLQFMIEWLECIWDDPNGQDDERYEMPKVCFVQPRGIIDQTPYIKEHERTGEIKDRHEMYLKDRYQFGRISKECGVNGH
jgi:hypothetical protein